MRVAVFLCAVVSLPLHAADSGTGFHLGGSAGWSFPLEGHGATLVSSAPAFAAEVWYQFPRHYLAANLRFGLEGDLQHGTPGLPLRGPLLATRLSSMSAALRGGFLLRSGWWTPYAGGGLAYMRQTFATNAFLTDGGQPDFGCGEFCDAHQDSDGVAAIAEAGVMFFRDRKFGRVLLGAEFAYPFFDFAKSPQNARFAGSAPDERQTFPTLVLHLTLLL